jgi:hypothetical protein
MIDSLASSALSGSLYSIAAIAFAAFGAVFTAAAIVSFFRLRPFGFVVRTLAGALFLALAALSGAIALGMQGYRELTHEDIAARVWVQPIGTQRFAAKVRYPDGHEALYTVAGDEIYVDARVLKWKPLANVLGLHTAYELDRISGRYRDIEQERTALRTVYALGGPKYIDLFGLRKRYLFLMPLYDAEYGSASFVPVTQPAELEVRVSNTGLLIREAAPAGEPAPGGKTEAKP